MVAIIFFEKYPTSIAIEMAMIFGSSWLTKDPKLSKRTAGKISAGKTADGT